MRQVAIVALICAQLSATSTGRAESPSNPLPSAASYAESIVAQFDESGSQSFAEPLTVEAQVVPAAADQPVVLSISARIAAGKHTYAVTQPPGGPRPTRIELGPSQDFRLLAPFRAFPEPAKRIEQGPVWTGLEIQEHEGEVTWYAPIELTAGLDPQSLELRGTIHAEVCETGGYCEPVQREFAARLAASSNRIVPVAAYPGEEASRIPQSAAAGSYQAQGSVVQISGRLEPATVRPGGSARLMITAGVPAGWHVYAYSPRDTKRGSKPTLIALATTTGLIPRQPTTDAPIKVDNSVAAFGPMKYHEGSVTWTTRLDVPPNAPPGQYRIAGLIGYQACEYRADGMGSCELSHAVRFNGLVQVGGETGGATPLNFTPAENYREAATVAAVFADYLDGQTPAVMQNASTQPAPPAPSSPDAQAKALDAAHSRIPSVRQADAYDLSRLQLEAVSGTLAYYLALAFLGGLILNLMPCVLPVIGLKVMSFVEQAGRSRTHALMLNLWYAAGIVSVFLLLCILAATINLSWGGQFGSTPFNVTIAAIVFAMALSLLGVWEIPIPGFFGSGSMQAAAAEEGPLGAFLKGVVTTILATPCTAPIMASAVAWAVTQPFVTTFVVFASLGLGMASPYVLVGVFPELLRFLPKPGRWMETFKQVTGFVLMATVVFILSFIEPAAIVPTVLLLLGIAIACWLIARTPFTAEFRDRVQSWALSGAIVLAFVAASFGWLYRDVMQPRFSGEQLARTAAGGAWQPFSLERLKEVAVDGGRTVLVDFSADWCFNCKVLEQAVLHTDDVERAIAESGAVTMYADFTDYPPEIERTIRALRANGVPVIAVFPGGSPYEPIVFRGGYTKQGLIDALAKATGRPVGVASLGGPTAAAAN